MKKWIAFSTVLVLAAGAVTLSERQKQDVPASPQALLYLVADTEQELTRMPVRFTRMSDDEEISIGNQLASAYTGSLGNLRNPQNSEVTAYISRVGAQLAARAHRKLPYKFHYIPDPYFINAFAIPGGHVYIGEGLVSLMDSEDELAAVLGHEIEHIDHYHCAERAQQEQALRHIPLGGLIAIPVEIFEAGYSKDQELEADREGTRLAVQSEYSPTGALRMFDKFQQLYQESQSKARSPQEELSQVAVQTLEGYFRSHPLPSERIAQIQKLIASERWPLRSERNLLVAYVFLTTRARKELEANRFSVAEQLATQSLNSHPKQPGALEILAKAQFAQAKFAPAAEAFRTVLQLEPTRVRLIEQLALSLAAADRKTASMQFQSWQHSAEGIKSEEVSVAAAGLALLAGNHISAEKFEEVCVQSNDALAPAWLGELGWWYYLAGNYEKASELLDNAVQQRPGDLELWVRRGWSKIELRRYSDALQNSGMEWDRAEAEGELRMMEAVAFWQAQVSKDALSSYETAAATDPRWTNPAWVKALYSPLVFQSVGEMQKELERQRKLRLAGNR